MKFNNIKIFAIAVIASMIAFNCSNDDDNGGGQMMGPDFSGTYVIQDQMARPAINTVFVSSGMKDQFNTTIPSQQGAVFQSMFEARLLALNPDFTTNVVLNADAEGFSTALATDVLTVSLDGTTTFFNGDPATVLTGRALADDVINTELILIFGGPDGSEKPGLTNDNVDANDKAFLSSFPYLAAPF